MAKCRFDQSLREHLSMALALEIETASGVNTTYHNIYRMEADYYRKAAWVMVNSYVDISSYQNGKTPLVSNTYIFALPLDPTWLTDLQAPEHPGDIRPVGYACLKNCQDFSAATDA